MIENLNIPLAHTGAMQETGGEHIPAKKGADRKASRPADVIFGSKLEASYQTALNLIGKVKSMARHRALSHDGDGKLAGTLNRFIDRVSEELVSSKVTPGQTKVAEEAPTLKEFLSP